MRNIVYIVVFFLICSMVMAIENKTDEKQGAAAGFQVEDVVSRASFAAEYKEYLCNEKMSYYLQNGGVKVSKLPDGRLLLVTIGRAACKGNAPEDRLRQETIAEMNGQAEAVKYIRTMTSASVQSVDTAHVVMENGKEKSENLSEYSSIVRMKAQAALRGMCKVGTWYSKDGQYYFLAKACYIEM